MAYSETVITLIGSKHLYAENYKKILQYTETEIILKTNEGRLVIEGDHLHLSYYTTEDLRLEGSIRCVVHQIE